MKEGYKSRYVWGELIITFGLIWAQMLKNLSVMLETQIWSLSGEDPLEKGMATHSSILPGEFHEQSSLAGYSPWGCKRVRHDLETKQQQQMYLHQCAIPCLQYSCLENRMDGGAWEAAVHGVAKSQTRLSDFTFTFRFPALEKEMATHSSVLAWRIPGTGEPGGLPSLGSHRVGCDWSDLAAAAAATPCNASLSEG